MSSKKTVQLFYDVVSPYSWFAFETLCRYQYRWNIDLKLRPFFLGAVMHTLKRKPPSPARLLYTRVDLPRLATYFDLPLRFPESPSELMFTKGTLKAQRFLTALGGIQPEQLEAMTRELWMRAWSRDEDIFADESLAEAGKKIGLSEDVIKDLLVQITEAAIKEKLKRTTQEAIELGAFGSPVIVTQVDGQHELIFGSDRFPILADLLGERWEGPNPGTPSKL